MNKMANKSDRISQWNSIKYGTNGYVNENFRFKRKKQLQMRQNEERNQKLKQARHIMKR